MAYEWMFEPDPDLGLATERDAMREYAANLADPDPARCACGGRGWTLTNYDTYEPCPAHPGQRHPEDVCGGCFERPEACTCHDEEPAPPAPPAGMTMARCARCEGQGSIPKFAHINGGRCFRCDGVGSVPRQLSPAERIERDEEANDRRKRVAYESAEAFREWEWGGFGNAPHRTVMRRRLN